MFIVLSIVALIFGASFSGAVSAAAFNIVYDDNRSGAFETDNIVGSGVFSYDGPVVLGAHSLSALEGINFREPLKTLGF